jgi:hypothetical protein
MHKRAVLGRYVGGSSNSKGLTPKKLGDSQGHV